MPASYIGALLRNIINVLEGKVENKPKSSLLGIVNLDTRVTSYA